VTTFDDAMRKLRARRTAGRFQVDSSNVLDAALCALPSDSFPEVRFLELSDSVATVELMSTKRIEAVDVGDVVQAGMTIRFEGEALELYAKYLRLRCKNGLVGPVSGRSARIQVLPHDSHLREVARSAAAAWESLGPGFRTLRSLPGTRESVPALFRSVDARAGLTPESATRLRRAWDEEEAESTKWHALNALTRVTTHSPHLTQRERLALSRIATEYAFGSSSVEAVVASPSRRGDFARGLRYFVRAGFQSTEAPASWRFKTWEG